MTDYSRSVPAGVHQTIDSDKFKGHSTTSKPSDRIESPSEIRDSIQIMPESDHRVGPTEHLFYTRVPAWQAKFGSAISEPCRAEQSQGIRTISYPHNSKGGSSAEQSERNREFPHSRYVFKLRHIYSEYCAPCCNHDLTGFEWG